MQLESFYIIEDQLTELFFDIKPESMPADEYRTRAIAQAIMATGDQQRLTADLFASVL